MKKILSCTLAFGLCLSVFSQKKAITDTGEEVLLNNNGTWKYASEPAKKETPLNPKAFTKGSASTFLLKSKVYNVGMWLDPNKWTFKKAVLNGTAEYEFQLKGKEDDLYGMMANENGEVPLEELKDIVISNAKEALYRVRLNKEEYRMVNGQKVLMLQFNAATGLSSEDTKFGYIGYYFSNKKGTTQITMYTYEHQLEKFMPAMEAHLNGFVVLPEN